MFLKSLTLRGFKSFADKTELTLEPGVTVIVGPNGSGKSNIVDALTWVLGSHSPKSLRGGVMSDVVFAGAPGRSALGRAVVEITIDNSDGALPVEFTEVSIARSMFANGETTYEINGVACRALDVQELLSDAGLGLIQHTIIGQGQLDAVLEARPGDRRAFIEEAAGILKHRRRRERALRKLSRVDEHVDRLGDIVAELRRSLKPLQRQAKAAAQHAELSAALAQSRRVQLVREMDQRARRWAAAERRATEQAAKVTDLDGRVVARRAQEAAARERLAEVTTAAEDAGRTAADLARTVERFSGLRSRILDAQRGLRSDGAPLPESDPVEVRARAEELRQGLVRAGQLVTSAEERARAAAEESVRAARKRQAHVEAVASALRDHDAATQRRLRWEGQVASLHSALDQAGAEDGRLDSRAQDLDQRAAAAADGLGAAGQALAARTAAFEDCAARRSATQEAVAALRRELDVAVAAERGAEREVAACRARAETLQGAAQSSSAGPAAVREAAQRGELDGVLGRLLDALEVRADCTRAAAAALGRYGEALLTTDNRSAAAAVRLAGDLKAGWVLAVPATTPQAPGAQQPGSQVDEQLACAGAQPLRAAVTADGPGARALHRLLGSVYVVEDFTAACGLAERFGSLTFVTREGRLAGPGGYATGYPHGGAELVARTRARGAASAAQAADATLGRCRATRADAEQRLAEARRALDAAAARQRDAQQRRGEAGEEARRLEGLARAATAELEAVGAQRAELAAETARQRDRLRALEDRQPDASPAATPPPDAAAETARLETQLAHAREAEVQARLAVAAAEQDRREGQRRLAALTAEAERIDQVRSAAQRWRERRGALAVRYGELGRLGEAALAAASAAAERATADGEQTRGALVVQRDVTESLRRETHELDEVLRAQQAQLHADDLARRDLRHALDDVRQRLRNTLGMDPDEALEAADRADLEPDDARDVALAEEVQRLSRSLSLLGPVNPLALAQFAELEQRDAFLSSQLDDLRESRRDLVQVVAAVDARIREVFANAMEDVAVQFERMFARLFPGGEGRLVLTDPDDLLTTGVDIEARPPGKRVKRLSLLSGGERSLTALAVLFAIFAARPSPFYVLDEVEAALDDVNLQRFLGVVEEFRGDSQLIVVSHHKPTMAVADRLYGVTMRTGGVSKVYGQRLEPAPAG